MTQLRQTPPAPAPLTRPPAADLYLNLIKRALVGMIEEDVPVTGYGWNVAGYSLDAFVPKVREFGMDLPSKALSSIGLRRMDNIQFCIEHALADGVPGDLIETGVWRGGATIFMRAVLAAYGVSDRAVWVADSFQGLPEPDLERHPEDAMWGPFMDKLAVSEEEVRANFTRYGLLDEQVKFLKGWFHETLPSAPITQLAVLRLDGDLYTSTWDTLAALYAKVAPGGFVIVDDYHANSCRKAIHEYRQEFGIHEPLQRIDHVSVYWRRDF